VDLAVFGGDVRPRRLDLVVRNPDMKREATTMRRSGRACVRRGIASPDTEQGAGGAAPPAAVSMSGVAAR
jgi:hypothetical protein